MARRVGPLAEFEAATLLIGQAGLGRDNGPAEIGTTALATSLTTLVVATSDARRMAELGPNRRNAALGTPDAIGGYSRQSMSKFRFSAAAGGACVRST